MKNLFITFVQETDTYLEVSNGFSYFPEHMQGDHLFTRTRTRNSSLGDTSEYDNVFCSLFRTSDFTAIAPFIQSNWVLGGPLIEFYSTQFAKVQGLQICPDKLDKLLGVDNMSPFIPYWERNLPIDTNKTLKYCASIGYGCDWGKCIFCMTTKNKTGSTYRKQSPSEILNSLPEAIGFKDTKVHTCVETLDTYSMPEVLKTLPNLSAKNIAVESYLRPTKDLVQILQEWEEPLTNLILTSGLETFSQTTLTKLGKGVQHEDILAVAALAKERGFTYKLLLIDNQPFTTHECLVESKDFIDRLSEYNDIVDLLIADTFLWNNASVVARVAKSTKATYRTLPKRIIDIPKLHTTVDFGEQYVLVLPESTTMYNNEVSVYADNKLHIKQKHLQ